MQSIADNGEYREEDFSAFPKLRNRIENKTLRHLETEGVFVFPESVDSAEDISWDQMVLKSVNGKILTGNVMGFIGYGNERLNIASRFRNNEEDYFFRYLLEEVLDYPNVVDLSTDAAWDSETFNFALLLFPRYLQAAMRKGLFRQYVRTHYNDESFRGSLDTSRHIATNTPFSGSVAYSQREFCADNDLMELVRHVIEFGKGRKLGRAILSSAKDEIRLVETATPRYRLSDRKAIISRNTKNPVRHAYYHEYSVLQKLCLLILRQQRYRVGAGSRQMYGILFDGAWLWEEYVAKLLGEEFWHPKNKLGSGAQQLFQGFNREEGLIYPDFIGKSKESRVIADAKYKPLKNILGRDYQQILAYMYRFDAKRGYFLYPETKQDSATGHENPRTLWLNTGTTYDKVDPRPDVFVVKQGFEIPKNSSSYGEFVEQMKKSEQEFKAAISKLGLAID